MSGLKPPTSQPARLSTATSEISGRKKVMLAPGHSLMDWIRLGRVQGDLSGVQVKRRDLTLADLAVHNKPDDIWMALRGKVYNITPYMHYHPGGEGELMRAAGKDGTELFDDIHNWVNVESMLEKCLVGYLTSDTRVREAKETKPRKPSVASQAAKPPSIATPSYDWYQTGEHVAVVVYTRWDRLRRELITTEVSASEVVVQILLNDYTYFVNFKPSFPLKDSPLITVTKGKAEIKFEKVASNRQWSSIGQTLDKHMEYTRTKQLTPQYRKWTVASNTPVTHDTVLLRLKAPKGFTMIPPIGWHIHIITDISGMQIGRSYTVITPSIANPNSDQEQEAGRAIHLMVKRYQGGTLSPWVTSVKAGDSMMVSNYAGNFDAHRLDSITHLILFAAGTGFTSMARVITYALDYMPSATFPVKLVFYNKTQGDILWRDQLDKLAAEKSRFSVINVLSREPSNSSWAGLKGHINAGHVKEYVPVPSKSCKPLLCICGPWAYNDTAESLAKLQGLSEEHIMVFSQT